jgi:hypothetical protein
MIAWTVAALVLSSTPSAGDTSASIEVIKVKDRMSFPVCAGVCGDTDLTVSSDGKAILRWRRLGSAKWKSYKYKISSAEWEEFRRIYAPLRPQGIKASLDSCNPDTLVISYDIRWDDAEPGSRLLACNEQARTAYIRGLRALRISPVGGKRLTAEELETLH